ncbi:hypothetical protein HYY69_00390 [Candidatus Woesearchaeota archaeon]|nr:hypothetical protein [Candidatus Woesearchaeota archaeon]
MKQVLTNDGSVTFFNEQSQETYHSTSGAVEEALKKFAEPTQVKELAKKGSIKILDICFGLGYNSAAALDIILLENPSCNVAVVGFEIDEDILSKILEINPSFKHYNLIKQVIKNKIENNKHQYYEIKRENVCVKVMLGDVRDKIKAISEFETFDICFFDPFSPKKCPELWNEELFKDIFKLLKKGGILTTYSCARMVRDNLKNAGFTVKEGPSVGRRAPSTIAMK